MYQTVLIRTWISSLAILRFLRSLNYAFLLCIYNYCYSNYFISPSNKKTSSRKKLINAENFLF